MRPPRTSTLPLRPHIIPTTTLLSHLTRNTTKPSPRLLSTATPPPPPPPSLLQTTNIPAPHTGHIRILTLNSPPNRNALSRPLLTALASHIASIKTQLDHETATGTLVGHGTRALILASALDDSFCAGADLKERRHMTLAETNEFLTGLRAMLNMLAALPVPTISCIGSIALGGGLELALATTFRVVASVATVGLPETRLAIIPGAGGTYRLRRLVGEARALDLILTGRRVGGEEAGVLGLCERVVSVRVGEGEGEGRVRARAREMVLEAGVEMARGICEGGPGAVMAAVRAVRGGGEEVERGEYEGVVGWEDREEGLRAFGEKRGARWTGRRKG